MNNLDLAALLASTAACVFCVVFALRRGQGGPVRANPDLEFVLEKMERERADFRSDLEDSTRYHMAHAEQLRADQQAKDKLVLQLLEDTRGQNAALFTALLQRSMLPASVVQPPDEPPNDVMTDEREVQIERLRAEQEDGAGRLPPAAQQIVDKAMENIRGART